MKIAIYGDSYGCWLSKWDTGKKFNTHLGLSWVEILENSGHDITNFCESGSAFLFSYENFFKNHKNFDLNIFIVSQWTRIYVKALDGIKIFGHASPDVEAERVKKLPFYTNQALHLRILASVKTYMQDWIDWDIIPHVQHGLVNNLWNMSPNTLVISGFDDSLDHKTFSLFSASKHELMLCDKEKYEKFDFTMLNCHRKCHFSEENNKVIADLVIDSINTSQKIVNIEVLKLQRPQREFSFYATQQTDL